MTASGNEYFSHILLVPFRLRIPGHSLSEIPGSAILPNTRLTPDMFIVSRVRTLGAWAGFPVNERHLES